MSENNLRKCKKCLQDKQRNLVGKFDDNNKRYNDETGKAWSGNTCPVCHSLDIKSRMQAMRLLRKSLKVEE
jgi:type II secretory ATPase GspE/PulE/Tfp pilus assembly ATPase PilB-like protein